jgi:CBS domain-containing protein
MNSTDNISPLIKQVKTLSPDDTVGKAIVLFQIEDADYLPVVESSRLVGIVSTEKLLKIASEQPNLIEITSVNMIMEIPETVLYPHFTIQVARQIFMEKKVNGLAVVSGNTYIGWLNCNDILGAVTHNPPPPRIGGMATPLGVYLYTTSITAGVGRFALFLTGLLMALSLFIIQNISLLFSAFIYRLTNIQLFKDYTLVFSNLSVQYTSLAQYTISPQDELFLIIFNSIFTTFLFLVVLRYAPFLSGYHAAEHMSVNAIENGEPLTTKNVAKMSRIHPRCGTNLIAILSFIYLGVTLIALTLRTHWGQTNISFVVIITVWMVIAIAMTWKKVGAWIQDRWTTRTPSKKELESGVKAAVELLSTYRMAPIERQSTWDRILMMGIQYVMMGILVVDLLSNVFQPMIEQAIIILLKLA